MFLPPASKLIIWTGMPAKSLAKALALGGLRLRAAGRPRGAEAARRRPAAGRRRAGSRGAQRRRGEDQQRGQHDAPPAASRR